MCSLEIAAVVGDSPGRAGGEMLAPDDDAVAGLARGDRDRCRPAVVVVDEVDAGVMRGDVRIAQDDGVVEGAADRYRPALDPPRLAHQAVAVDRLDQRQRRLERGYGCGLTHRKASR